MNDNSKHIPDSVARYFWGDNLKDLSWVSHQKYMIETILENGDEHAVRWLFMKISKTSLLSLLPRLRLSAKSRNFWNFYLE
ncbi:MAG TPA: hypothetical protein DCW55_04430 [Candidatus Pacebacteria bacterium]|nr:hypothetical protein [Candidatus Paceibacterota bacterium]